MEIAELHEMARQQRLVLMTPHGTWAIWTLAGALISKGLTLAEVETILRSHTPKPPADPSLRTC